MAMARGRVARALLAMVAAGPLLSACGGGDSDGLLGQAPAPCPSIGILADGADLTRFSQGAGFDLTRMVVDARIVGFDARCDYTGRDRAALDVRITPRFEAERGPAAEGRAVDLPWFVAVSDPEDRVLDRRAYATRVGFGTNVTRTRVEGEAVRMTLPLTEGRQADDYLVRLSFQLTPEELELNRRRGPR